jgi:hypothetical protein
VSKRLQVLLDEAELRDLQRVARAHRMTVAEWVRQTLRHARRLEPMDAAAKKLRAVRDAVTHDFPTADIDIMLGEIERGYADRAPR